jgi:hypothetical protein
MLTRNKTHLEIFNQLSMIIIYQNEFGEDAINKNDLNVNI